MGHIKNYVDDQVCEYLDLKSKAYNDAILYACYVFPKMFMGFAWTSLQLSHFLGPWWKEVLNFIVLCVWFLYLFEHHFTYTLIEIAAWATAIYVSRDNNIVLISPRGITLTELMFLLFQVAVPICVKFLAGSAPFWYAAFYYREHFVEFEEVYEMQPQKILTGRSAV